MNCSRFALSELAQIKYGKNQSKVENPNGKYPIYGTGGLMSYTDEFLYDKPSVLIGRKGTIGKVRYMETPFWTVDTLFYTVVNDEIINPKYLYYKLSQIDLNEYNEGTTIPSLRTDTLNRIELDIQDRDTQERIVKIISPIENKIASNNRTNDNLFKVVQAIYDDWFIKFNYPESNGEFIESEFGPIPKGWSIGFIDDKILTKIAKSGVETYLGKKSYVATADVSGRQITGSILLSFDERPSRANMQPVAGSVWFAKMENSVKNILVTEYMKEIHDNYIFSTGFMGLECLNNSAYYIWSYINSKTFEEIKNNLSTGTLMAGISNSTIKSAQYVIPPHDLLDKFNLRVDGIFRTIYNNELENQRLTRLRGTLLPELLNGKIDISNIDI